MQFDRVGVFTYSHEEDTSAYDLKDELTQEEKESRAQDIIAFQQDISFEKNQQKIGQTVKVLIDKKEAGRYIGRTEFDSPDVDNEVLVKATDTNYVRIGDFANVKITDASDFDLYGDLM